jgi:hypothetical protein
VILADGAVNQVPALSTLRDLVRPPDRMTAIMMEIVQPASWSRIITMRRSALSEGCSVRC